MNQQWVKFGSSKNKTYLLKEVVEGSNTITKLTKKGKSQWQKHDIYLSLYTNLLGNKAKHNVVCPKQQNW
jgi:hypothetical protein